jgi:hypothetical protein
MSEIHAAASTGTNTFIVSPIRFVNTRSNSGAVIPAPKIPDNIRQPPISPEISPVYPYGFCAGDLNIINHRGKKTNVIPGIETIG